MDLAPGTASPMHRTVSLDYCVVLEGVLEFGIRLRGDTADEKRGHVRAEGDDARVDYRNTSHTEWARMLMVYVDSTKPVVGGKELGESMVSGEDPE
jgi:hypothetical protein